MTHDQNNPPTNTNIAASSRVVADGEQDILLHPETADPAAVNFERQLRAAVGRVMHDAATPPPDLRSRTLSAVNLRLEEEATTIEHAAFLSRAREFPGRRKFAYRTAVVVGLLGFGVLMGASLRLLPMPTASAEESLPIGEDITQVLHAAFSRAKLVPDSNKMGLEEVTKVAASVLGEGPRMPDPSASDVRLVNGTASPSQEGMAFQAHFAVFSNTAGHPADRDEVLVLVRRASDAERDGLTESRLYTILGTNLVLHVYRENELVYYFAADAKSAAIRIAQLMNIDTHGTNTDRGLIVVNLTDLHSRMREAKR